MVSCGRLGTGGRVKGIGLSGNQSLGNELSIRCDFVGWTWIHVQEGLTDTADEHRQRDGVDAHGDMPLISFSCDGNGCCGADEGEEV